MKQILLLFGLLTVSVHGISATAIAEGYELTGIVNLPEFKSAIFSFNRGRAERHFILKEGQREKDLAILGIQPTTATVNAMLHRTNRLVFQLDSPPVGFGAAPTIQFTNVSLQAVLDVYEAIAQRSLLLSPKLPKATLTIQLETTNQTELLMALAQKLSESGVELIPDGARFIAVLTTAEAKGFKPAAPPPVTGTITNPEKIFPAGSITFNGASLEQCALICADLMAKPLNDGALDAIKQRTDVRFHQITPLTRAECVYALETSLKLHGIEFLPGNNGTLKIAPFGEPNRGVGEGQK